MEAYSQGMARAPAHPTLPTVVQATYSACYKGKPGKKLQKKPLKSHIKDGKLKKNPTPKSHIDARNLQKKPPKSLIDASKHLALPRCRCCGACHVPPSRPGPRPISLQVKSLSCLHAAGRVGGSLATVGGAISYPTKTQADMRTVLDWAAEPCLQGQVLRSCVQPQPQLGRHQEGRLGAALP